MRGRLLRVAALLAGLATLAWMAFHPPAPAGEMPRPGFQAVRDRNGLVHEDAVAGTGAAPAEYDRVAVHYRAWLPDGTLLLDTRAAGGPVRMTLGLGQAVAGFEAGVRGMRVGGRRRLWLPAGLAYGVKGAPGVPANSDLVFEVELLGVRQAEEGPFPAGRNTGTPPGP